jgi:RNA polymerase sigma factor (sigma-70 family)
MNVKPDDYVGELVERYRDGSPEDREELFTQICLLIQPMIRNCAERYYGGFKRSGRVGYKEKEDVILETYEYIIEQNVIDNYEGKGGASFQAYIYNVLWKYLAGEIRRRKGEGGRAIGLDEREHALGEAGGDERSRQEIARAVRRCIEGLSVRERILIALFYYYRDPSWGREMTDEDALELIEIINPPLSGKERPIGKVSGVSTSRHRAVLRVKECLEKGKLFERFGEILQLI